MAPCRARDGADRLARAASHQYYISCVPLPASHTASLNCVCALLKLSMGLHERGYSLNGPMERRRGCRRTCRSTRARQYIRYDTTKSLTYKFICVRLLPVTHARLHWAWSYPGRGETVPLTALAHREQHLSLLLRPALEVKKGYKKRLEIRAVHMGRYPISCSTKASTIQV